MNRMTFRMMGTVTAALLLAPVSCKKDEVRQPMIPDEQQQQASPPAAAQDRAAPQPQAEPSPSPPPAGTVDPGRQEVQISDKQLDRFVEAQKKLKLVQSGYEQRMSKVETPDQARELQQEANEMIKAKVQEVGLTLDEYSTIARQIQLEPALQQRLEGRMTE